MQAKVIQLSSSSSSSSSSATGTYLQVVLNNPNSISSSFTVTVTGNNPQPYSFSLSSISPQFVKLDPGSFAVSIDTSYPHSYSKDCTGTISAGQNLSCPIHITIMQTSFASQGNTSSSSSSLSSSSATGTYLQVVLNNPNSISSSFTVTVTGNNPQPYSFSLSSISPQFVKLDPGSFAVSIDTGYPHSYSKDCTGYISAGQNLSCLYTHHSHPVVPSE